MRPKPRRTTFNRGFDWRYVCALLLDAAFLLAACAPPPALPNSATVLPAPGESAATGTVLAPTPGVLASPVLTTALTATAPQISPGVIITLAPAATSAIITTTFPELTYEQDLAIHPPPPTEFRASTVAGSIQLSWAPPPPVTVPHHYGDQVLYFKIYRRTEQGKFDILARTDEMTYADKTAAPGIQYYYTVTDVRENDNESAYAPEVAATLSP